MNYDELKGRIFDIQRFSIHDGIGIRTVVFLKGCYLRCKWCCNPESQSNKKEIMVINGENVEVGEDITVRNVMNVVERDRPYFMRSGGGITLSGGEVLFQHEFAHGLLYTAKQMGINTAIESMGYSKWENIEKILPYLDTYLLDIKHINPHKHKEFTGSDNILMLENAVKISKIQKTNLVIRVPVIPTFNDSLEEIMDIALFSEKLQGIRTIHLLPYHGFGEDKYEQLGRIYEMRNIIPPQNKYMENLKNEIERTTNLNCIIGG